MLARMAGNERGPGGRRPGSALARFVQVRLLGITGAEGHVLPPERSDWPSTLCGLPRPGRWYPAGFTSRLDEIECAQCREEARAQLRTRAG